MYYSRHFILTRLRAQPTYLQYNLNRVSTVDLFKQFRGFERHRHDSSVN